VDARNRSSNRLTAAEVLRRYKDELIPAFCEIQLEDVNQVGNFSERPLHVAAARGKLEEISALVDAGADVNAAGDLGNTPLHEAVGQGHREAVQFLLDHKADPNKKNEFGQTAMEKAELGKRDDIIDLLRSYLGRF